jgi:hypothetical protein
MEVKINIPLIDKISAVFSKQAPPVKRREETTETSFESLAASYYYKKIKLERTRKAKYADYMIMDDEYPEVSTCLAGNTLIQTIGGPVRIKDLVGKSEVIVFSYDETNKKIVLARTTGGAVKTRQNSDVWDVFLDDGRVIRATEDHLFMMRDGSYRKINELRPYDSLMPFYIRIGRQGYRQVFQPNGEYSIKKRWEFVYRLSALFKYGEYPDSKLTIHHSDFNRLNDHPGNILVVSRSEHGDVHLKRARSLYGGKLPVHRWTEEEIKLQSFAMRGNAFAKGNKLSAELRKKLSEIRKGVPKPPEWREALALANKKRRIDLDESKVSEILAHGGTTADVARHFNVSYSTAKRRKVEMFSAQRMALNHCVLKIEYAGKEDVYDLSVPIYHNFACEAIFVHNCLDLYADNATKEKGKSGNAFEVKSKDSKAQNIIDELLKRTKLQETIWDTARNMAKMGDDFDEVVVDEDRWVDRLKPLEPATINREQDEYGLDAEKPYTQKDESGTTKVAEFERWQIIHWKNGGQKKPYGESVMKPIRRVYKQLQMMEDGMVIGRLTRSHLRYKILVDVDGLDREERKQYVEDVKKEFKKKRMINPVTGMLETTQNPLSSEEDFFLGVTKESKADVDVLQGATNLGNIRDVEYFQTKLFAGLKVPKAFVGLEKDVKAKATIVEEDIQFARTVGRIRKALRMGLTQIIDYQLILRDVIPTKGLYEISFEPISMVDEMRKWTMEKLKAEVAKIYRVDMQILGDEFILRTFLGLPDEEIAAVLKDKPAPLTSPSPKKATTPSLRAAGATGMTTPQVGGLNPMAMVSKKEDGSNGLDRSDGFHIVTLQMMNLVETLRDLVDLELN